MAKELTDSNSTINESDVRSLDFLSGGGEMGKFIRSKDWSATPLGPPDTWPQSLRTTVSLCIASNFPIDIIWGPHRVQIYNDGYWPITGDMHPTSMGQDFRECWRSAWPVIGQAFEEAYLGKTRFLENQRIFLDRYGYKEETFFTFSFSPILDESGDVGGLFHPVIELTQQTLAERRLNILSTLANHTVKARTADEAAVLIMDCLKDFELDLPFVLLYSVTADGKETILNGCVGVEKDSPLAPAKTNLEDLALKGWPFSEVMQNGKVVHVEELAEIFGAFNCGSYPEPPTLALVFPVRIPSADRNKFFLIAGVSSRRKLDEKYLLFYELLAESVTNILSKARAYEEERRKVEALAEIDKAKTVFFSNISHEFRTPLTLMLSPLEELLNQKQNNFSEVENGYIETTHRNAIRLLKLVNTLLDFSRIESGREQAVFSLVDIVLLTKNLASNFRSIIEKAGLKLSIKADAIIKPVYVDKQMWEKIVFNLLSNAFKYTLEGKITVEVSAEEEYAVLKVRDTGVGIPEHEIPKMFERFHRVQNVSGRTYEGTGIGLSLIKELVLMHQGSIHVESKLYKGSVFTVKIPFGKEHLDGHEISKSDFDADELSSNIYIEEIETLLETEKQEIQKSSFVKEKNTLPTILVVDDNADMREHISSILSNYFNVITANNGMAALHKMKETIPSLVLSDIMMPVMDGMGLLKEIRSNKFTENIPVIFLTARAGEESRIEGWETGADDYLVKPFSSRELVARVGAQINLKKLQKEALNTLRNEEKQQAYLLKLSDALRPLDNAVDIEEAVTEIALQFMDADRCYYSKIEGENVIILRDAVRGNLPSVAGVHSIGNFALYKAVLNAGRPFVVDDVRTSNLLDEDLKEVCQQFQYGSFINVPVIKNGKSVGLFSLVESKPRKWTDLELQLTVETAERTWAAVERATAEQALRKSEEQLALDLIDAKRLQAFSTQLIHEDNNELLYEQLLTAAIALMHSGMASIQVYHPEKKQLQLLAHKGYHPESAAHWEWVSIDSKSPCGAALIKGERCIITDVEKDEHTSVAGSLHYYQLSGIRAVQSTPLISRNGSLLGMVSTLWREPHQPLERDLQLFDVLARQAADLIDRKKSVEKLKESESRFRTMADAAPVLIWTLDAHGLSSYYNKTFLDFIGVSKGEDISDWEKIVHPGDVQSTLNTINSAIAERRSYSLECRLLRADGIWRWVLSQGNPRLGTNNEFLGFVGSSVDITERKHAEEIIQESESRFRNLVRDASAAIIVLTGPEMIVEVVNEAYGRLIDLKPDDMLGKPLFSMVPDATEYYLPLLEKVRQTGETLQLQNSPYSVTVNGKRIDGFLHIVYQPYRSADGNILGVMAILQDVTEAVLARKKIEESEKKFEAAIHAVEGIIWTNNASGEMEGEQLGWSKLTGQSLEEYEGYGWAKAVHPDDVQATIAAWNKAVETKSTFKFEHRLLTKQNGWRLFSVKAVPAFNENGDIQQWVGVHTDITEKKEAEQTIADSESKYRNLFNSMDQGFSIVDMVFDQSNKAIDYTFVEVNPMFEKQTGLIGATGKSARNLLPDLEERWFEIYGHVALTGTPKRFTEVSEVMQRWFEVYAFRIGDNDSRRVAILFTDISDQVKNRKKIEESEKYFRRLAESVPAIIWITESDGSCSYLNKLWYDYTGQTEEEAMGFGWLEATHPDDKEQAAEVFIKANAAQQPYSILFRLRNSKGEYHWAVDSGSPRFNAANEFEGMIGTVIDVHEEKLAEKKLAYRTALLEAHNQANVDGILLVDAKGKILSFNQRFIEIWNMPQHIVDAKDDEAALSFAMTQLLYPQQFLDKVKYLYEHPKETTLDELEFKNGKIVERYGYPVVGEDSIYYAWSWTFKDITAQKKYERTIIESEERFRSLAQTLPQLVWVTDALGNSEFASLRWKEYSGIEPEGEKEWKAIVHPDDYDHINATWMHSLSTGEVYNSDVRLKNKNGEYRWHTVIGKSVLDKDNKIVKWVGAFTDTHSEKLFMQELESQVKLRTNELEKFNQELERKNKELESFAYISSHDLQEPLRKIQIFSARIIEKENQALSETGKDNFMRMQNAANRMQTLINDLLVYSKTNITERKFEKTDLNKIIQEIKEDLSDELKEKQATIETTELCNINIIPFQFRQLMYNLIGNALKFSIPNTAALIKINCETAKGIHFNNVKLEPQKNYIRITVSDNGIGFEQQYSKKIFEVFQRLHGRSEYIGTGIGLSIVKRIVENHNGIITAESELGKGATFHIFLPAS